jgi:hypothetical protein
MPKGVRRYHGSGDPHFITSFRFVDQQMYVLGHHYVTVHAQPARLAHAFQ